MAYMIKTSNPSIYLQYLAKNLIYFVICVLETKALGELIWWNVVWRCHMNHCKTKVIISHVHKALSKLQQNLFNGSSNSETCLPTSSTLRCRSKVRIKVFCNNLFNNNLYFQFQEALLFNKKYIGIYSYEITTQSRITVTSATFIRRWSKQLFHWSQLWVVFLQQIGRN